jgi:hypothetical protein
MRGFGVFDWGLFWDARRWPQVTLADPPCESMAQGRTTSTETVTVCADPRTFRAQGHAANQDEHRDGQ